MYVCLAKKNIKLNFDQGVIRYLVKASQKDGQGARDIKRAIQGQIETPLSQKILEDEITPGQTADLTLEKSVVKITVK
jgi:ATP-dependent Clp protease ATP-binding subunit ClpA